MSIIRTERKNRYTHVPSAVLEDSNLSFRARGILAYLLSKPDNWSTRSDVLVHEGAEGRDAIRTAMRELEKYGYMSRSRVQDAETGFWETLTVVRDYPSLSEPPEPSVNPSEPPETSTEDGFPGFGNPGFGKPGAKATTEQQLLTSSQLETPTATQSSSLARARRAGQKATPRADPAEVSGLGHEKEEPEPKPRTRKPRQPRKAYDDLTPRQQGNAAGLETYFTERKEAWCLEHGDGRIGNNAAALRGYFAQCLRQISPAVCREMVDVFFTDGDLTIKTGKTASLWKLFIRHGDLIRSRMDRRAGVVRPDDDRLLTPEEIEAWMAETDAA